MTVKELKALLSEFKDGEQVKLLLHALKRR